MRGSEPGSAVPSRNEIHIKRELLEKYSLPDATVMCCSVCLNRRL
jgi:hypothetical protein